jgi:hypothetical protein
MFGGQWKVLGSVALGMFHAWLPMEGSNVWWPLEGKKKTSFSHFSHSFPNKFYLNFFSIDFKVLFYHGFRSLLYVFLSFSLTYKFQSRISVYQVFHTLIVKLILIEDFFLSLNLWHHA